MAEVTNKIDRNDQCNGFLPTEAFFDVRLCSYYSKVTLFFYLCSKKTSCQNFSKKYSATGKKKQSAFLIQCTILFDKRDIASRKATAELVRER